MVVCSVKPRAKTRGGHGMPHPVGVFVPELKVSDAGGEATPRGLPPKAHRGSPVCPFGLTGRGSYHTTLVSDNGVFIFNFSGLRFD